MTLPVSTQQLGRTKDILSFDKLGDSTTRLMLEQILTDEEDHADTWETVLAKRPK